MGQVIMMRLQEDCRGCGARLSRQVFRMDPMPLAGAFAETAEGAVAAERLPLTWLQCDSCELVQVAEDVPDDVLYGAYCYASSDVPDLVHHFEDYATFLAHRFPSPRGVLEMGCNDGVLLRRLPESWELVGVDPSDVAAHATRWNDAYKLINAPFGTALGLHGYDLVLASNCLAHVTDIADCVEAAARALVPGGEFWVEVHDLEATLRTGQWDTIYHEHKAEYSERSLRNVVIPHGFSVVHVSQLPLHGGLLRMGFVKDGPGEPFAGSKVRFGQLRRAYDDRRRSTIYRIMECALDRNEPLIAYGAAGRATVWFNQLPELTFAAVIDDSPLRAGRFVPGVGWPIVSWVNRPASTACVITAWNYAEAIRARRQYAGRWLQTWGAP